MSSEAVNSGVLSPRKRALPLLMFMACFACISHREELMKRTRTHVQCSRHVRDEARESYDNGRGWPLDTSRDGFEVENNVRDPQGNELWTARCDSGVVYRCIDRQGSVSCQHN